MCIRDRCYLARKSCSTPAATLANEPPYMFEQQLATAFYTLLTNPRGLQDQLQPCGASTSVGAGLLCLPTLIHAPPATRRCSRLVLFLEVLPVYTLGAGPGPAPSLTLEGPRRDRNYQIDTAYLLAKCEGMNWVNKMAAPIVAEYVKMGYASAFTREQLEAAGSGKGDQEQPAKRSRVLRREAPAVDGLIALGDAVTSPGPPPGSPSVGTGPQAGDRPTPRAAAPVSYTHLTLPTICSV